MGYDDMLQEEPRTALSTAQHMLGLCVRLLGLAVLVAGVWTAVIVITEAWGLYQEPARIERFAVAIERGSNLDRAFAPRLEVDSPPELESKSESAERSGAAPEIRTGADPMASANVPEGAGADGQYYSLRLSYFAAWFVGLALLVVLGILAMSAISTGGQLALYDMQVKRLSREIVHEVQRIKKAA